MRKEQGNFLHVSLHGLEIPFYNELRLLLALNSYHISLGGSGLEWAISEYEESEPTDSDFDIHRGTAFANTGTWRKAEIPSFVDRSIVYDAVRELGKGYSVQATIQELEDNYPRDHWENKLPRGHSMLFVYERLRESPKNVPK